MSSFKILVNKMDRHIDKLNSVTYELSEKVENKLGEGWCVIHQTDGLCVADVHANNYAVPTEILVNALNGDKCEAIKIIRRYGI